VPDPALSVAELQFGYRQTPVVVGLRWELQTGTLATLFGLSGAGKSTLLELLAGIQRPEKGTVRILGLDPVRPAARKLLGYMPQGGGLYTDLTVEDNLRIFGEGAGLKPGQDLEKLLEFLELRKRRKEPVSELAMGWQKRVSLGAALITQAPVLLLDEPLAHADAAFAAKAWAHFRDLAAQGRTVVVATSQPQGAAQGQRLAVMRAGRLAFDGDAASIATPGQARVVLTYQKRSATRTEELDLQDYRTELVSHLLGEDRPFEVERLAKVEVRQAGLEERLTRLLVEDTP
jgi:ABC-2 type transport system ATP-binding protein